MTTNKRALYHSELRERTEAGPVQVQLLSPPRESRYPGKPAYCRIVFAGEPFERSYEIENDAVRGILEQLPLSTPLRIIATGSRGDARLEVVGAHASESPPQRKQAAELPGSGASPAGAPSLARSYFEALEVAATMVEAFKSRHGREPTECERTIACSLWIEQNRSAGRKPLSGGKA